MPCRSSNTRGAVLLLGALLNWGCGGDDDRAAGSLAGSCALGVELSGALSRSQRASEHLACLTSHSFDSGIDNVFLSTAAELSVELSIADIAEGQTGRFPAGVELELDAQRFRTSPNGCSVTVTEHAFFSRESTEIGELRRYRVVGSGSCSEPANGVNEPAQSVTVGPFQFRQPAVWRD